MPSGPFRSWIAGTCGESARRGSPSTPRPGSATAAVWRSSGPSSRSWSTPVPAWSSPADTSASCLHLLHIFGLAAMIKEPLITWSAGAMALSERVVLFHDQGPPGRQHPEVYAEGLGAFSGVLPFPHPRRRLRLREPAQMSLLARRFAPRICLLLPDGVRVDLGDGQPLPAGARRIDAKAT